MSPLSSQYKGDHFKPLQCDPSKEVLFAKVVVTQKTNPLIPYAILSHHTLSPKQSISSIKEDDLPPHQLNSCLPN